MSNTSYCIGLMSGTSLDGLDVVYVKLSNGEKYKYQIIESCTYSYSSKWIVDLKSAFDKEPSQLELLDKLYGRYLGELVNVFIEEKNIKKIDFIASHGHTIFHKPNEGFTLQIGDGKEIAKVTGQKVVYDFRTQDVSLGGQGAPLVPIGDELLFNEYDYCLNLGGFANVSFEKNKERLAFDICPVNIVMNHYMNAIGKDYDDKGSLASSGKINNELLSRLNDDPFYKLDHPKSLGFEFVKENVIPLLDSFEIELKDLLRTFVEHVAIQIGEVVNKNKKTSLLVTGGGTYNRYLLDRIDAISNAKITVPDKKIVEYKEALIFALLGFLKINGAVNCLKCVTGATENHSSGVIIN